MPSIKYKCNNCNHNFIGDDFTSECPNCHDSNIFPLGSSGSDIIEKFVRFFKENKYVGYALFIILLIIIIYNVSTCKKKDEKALYGVVIDNQNIGYIEINIVKYIKQKNGSDKSETQNFSNLKGYFNFRYKDGSMINFYNNSNKYYPCDSVFTVFWDNPSYPKLKNPKDTFELVNVTFANGKRDPKADLNFCDDLDIIAVNSIGNCSILIKTNFDNIAGSGFFISITGRGGPYKKAKVWDAHGINKIDVWGYVEGRDTSKFPPIEYVRNGDSFSDNTCKPFDPAALIAEITDAGNDYGKDPSNRTLRNKFAALIDQSTNIYLDNRLLPGLSDLLNECQVQNQNTNRTFRVTVQVDVNSKKVSVYFK